MAASASGETAEARLSGLFPDMGPWAAAIIAAGPAPAAPLGPELPTLRRNRLLPYVTPMLVTARRKVEPDIARLVQRETFALTVGARAVEHAAAAMCGELTRAGIATVVAKGPALASHCAMPSTRTFGDADVFVVPENLPRALAIMTANGWRENAASRQPRRYFYRWCRESVNLERRSGESVDVHHRPSPWIWSRGLPVDTMIRRATAHEVGEHALLFADLADNALVSALQLITDHRDPGGKLLAWRDLRELGARDPVAVARRANDVGLGGVLRALVGGMPAPLRPGGLDDLLDGHIAHPRRIVSLLEAARRGAFLHAHVARLPALNAALYLGGTAAPSRAFLQERYGSDRAPLTTWWRDLRSWPDGNATAAHPNAGGPVAAPGAR